MNTNIKMMLNQLPSRTWNRLGMNESFLTIEKELNDHVPSILSEAKSTEVDPRWASIEGGVGKDMDALTEGATVVSVCTEKGEKMEQPVILNYNYKNGENAISRLWFHAKEGSKISAVIFLRSEDAKDNGLSALQTKVYAEAGASVHLYYVQLLGTEMLCLNDVAGICDDGAHIEVTKLELGAREAYAGVLTDLKGRESSFKVNLGYHVEDGQKVDMNYVALHHGPKTESLMEISGTLEENAYKVFRGTIDFQRGSQGAKGTEMENVLLLADDLVNQSIPLILCKEEDVEGNHGASIGQLDDKLLFYLGSRGIAPEDAKTMISEARIDAICNLIPCDNVKDEVHEFEAKRRELYDSGK